MTKHLHFVRGVSNTMCCNCTGFYRKKDTTEKNAEDTAVHGSMNHDLPFLSQACKLFVIIGFYTKGI